MSPRGRSLPTADVGNPAAHLGWQLSGGKLTRPTGAGRPKAVLASRAAWPTAMPTEPTFGRRLEVSSLASNRLTPAPFKCISARAEQRSVRPGDANAQEATCIAALRHSANGRGLYALQVRYSLRSRRLDTDKSMNPSAP